jgi:hypothetical protein
MLVSVRGRARERHAVLWIMTMRLVANRQTLLNRRLSETMPVTHAGQEFFLSVSRYYDGRAAEIFLSSRHVGSPIEAIARDAAVLVSIALQFGAPLATIRAALTKDHDGSPATAIGAALDRLED